MPAPEIRIAPHQPAWPQDAATLLQELAHEALKARSRFLLVLSGGSTPKRLYQTLAAPPWNRSFDWSRTQFFFGDERCVPPAHPESNYGLANATLFMPLGIDVQRIHRMAGEDPSPEAAARHYERVLREVTRCPAPGWPQLDVVLLGLGDDGHTVSLFPGTAALREQTHLVAVGQSPNGIAARLTLTLGVINRANVVLFLVSGASKASIVRRVLQPKTEADRGLPAALVKPETGRLIWLLDQAAASELTANR